MAKKAKKVLFRKDVKELLKLVDFDPNSDEFKFLTEAYRIGDFNYFRLRAIEQISTLENTPGQNKKNIIAAIRLLMLALKEAR